MDIHNYIVFNGLLWDRHLLLWKCDIANFNELLKQYYYEVFFSRRKKDCFFSPKKIFFFFLLMDVLFAKSDWFYEYYHGYCIVYINNFLCLISSCRDTSIAFCRMNSSLICVLSLNFLPEKSSKEDMYTCICRKIDIE